MAKKPQKKTHISPSKESHRKNNSPFQGIALLNQKRKDFLIRRPHRSFKLTRRRDYMRKLQLPGYWAFSFFVAKTLIGDRRLFLKFIALNSTIISIIVLFGSQENLKSLEIIIDQYRLSGGVENLFQQNVGAISDIINNFGQPLTEVQQLYVVMIILIDWLVIVWLLRQRLAGTQKIKLRDGLYNATSPVISTLTLLFLVVIQSIPFGLVLLTYSIADATGAFDTALFTTLFWIAASILTTLSLYFLSSSLLALVIVTLPGMYPWRALRIASDLVVGRRMRVLMRILWMIALIVLVWFVSMIIVVWIVANLLPYLTAVIPFFIVLLLSFSLLWIASYMYLLYRRIVDDSTPPA